MKKVIMLMSLMIILNACGKKGGGSEAQNIPDVASGSPCVFKTLSVDQIQSINVNLANTVKEKFPGYCDRNGVLKTLGSHLVFEILSYNNQADILGAIENDHLVGFISMIYDGKSCEISLMDSNEINLAKQCKWDN